MIEKGDKTIQEILLRESGTSIKEIAESLSRYSKSVEAMKDGHDALMKKYPNEWILYYGEEVVAHADTFDQLIDILDEREDIVRSEVIIRHLEVDPDPLIL